VIGGKLALESLYGVSANLGVRQSWLSGKTDIRRLSADLKWSGFKGVTVVAGFDFDLLLARFANARWMGRYDGAEFGVQLEYLRVSPILSADSIWMYFAQAPRDGGKLRFYWFPVGPLRIYVDGVLDSYNTAIQSMQLATIVAAGPQMSPPLQMPSSLSFGGGGGAAVRFGPFRAMTDLTFKTGYGGRQIWWDLNGGYAPVMGSFNAEARVSVANVTDDVNALLKGTYVGFQVFGGYLVTRASRISLVFEANFGPATKADTKVFALYDLKAVF
jgi:hypothetical protein